jgi:hypothetical protein
VVCYPRFQLLPEVEENILGFVEEILLEAVWFLVTMIVLGWYYGVN